MLSWLQQIIIVKLCFTTMFHIGFISWQKVLYLHYFVACILWDFIVLGLVLSWWKIEHEMKKQCSFAIGLREGFLQKRHVRSIWLEVEESCQAVNFASISREGLTRETLAKSSRLAWLFSFQHVLLTWLFRKLASREIHLFFNSYSIFHQLNTKPNTIKSHKIQWTKLKQLQHFLSWNKAT